MLFQSEKPKGKQKQTFEFLLESDKEETKIIFDSPIIEKMKKLKGEESSN